MESGEPGGADVWAVGLAWLQRQAEIAEQLVQAHMDQPPLLGEATNRRVGALTAPAPRLVAAQDPGVVAAADTIAFMGPTISPFRVS